jgi:sec-independent protein translocase protein TatA
MSIGIWQIIIIAVVVVMLFGRGKISDLMGDVAKGITSFRKGLKEGNEEMKQSSETLDNETGEPVDDKKNGA